MAREAGGPKTDHDAVQVAVRIRPLSANESSQGSEVCVNVVDGSVVLAEKQYDFDAAFPETTQQDSVFTNLVLPMIDQYFDGYNATVFAYGQTGSGKTYTMGNDFASSVASGDRGIISRVIEKIFERKNAFASPEHFVLKLSYLEILNEEIRDLLANDSSDTLPTGSGLSVRGDGNRGIVVNGLSEHSVDSADTAESLLRSGALLRATASTSMNSQSSRSHAVCTITMEHYNVRAVEGGTETRYSKFHSVDLAGSERVRRTNSVGARFKEGVNINRGLLALGNVINALCERSRTNSENAHIPYRDSKLTRLLQDSLGGNSKTLMIACVSPADVNYEETSNTLRYASRTRNIVNKSVINKEHTAGNDVAFLKQQLEIVRLQLSQQTQGVVAGSALSPMHVGSDISLLQQENCKLKNELRQANNAKDKWKRIANELTNPVHGESSIRKLSQILDSTVKSEAEAGVQDEQYDWGSKNRHLSRLEQLRDFQRQRSIASKENIAVQRNDGIKPLKRSHVENVPSIRTTNTDLSKATRTVRSSCKNSAQDSKSQSMEMITKLLHQVVASYEAIYVAKEAVCENVADRKALALEKARVKALPSAENVDQLAILQRDLRNKTDNIRILQQKLASIDKKLSLPPGLFPAQVDICHDLIRYLVDTLLDCKEEYWTLSSCRRIQDAAIKKLSAERQSLSKNVLKLKEEVGETVKKLEDLQHQSTKKKLKKRKQRESYERIETLFSSSDEEADNNDADPDYVENEQHSCRSTKRRKGGGTTVKQSTSGAAMDEVGKADAVFCCSCHGKCATKACECKLRCLLCGDGCSCNLTKCRNRKVADSGGNFHEGTADLAITSFVPSTPKRPTPSEGSCTEVPA